MKIRTKLFLVNLLIVLLLLGSITYVYIKRGSETIFENVVENASLSLSQVSENLDDKLASYEEIANTLFLNETLEQIMVTQYDSISDAYEDYFNEFEPLASVVKATKDIRHLKIYTDNESFDFAEFTLIDGEIRQSEWYRKLMKNEVGGIWTAPYVNEFEDGAVFSFRKRLNRLYRDSPLVSNIEIQVEVLNELIDEERKSKRYIFSLADGTVLIDSAEAEQAVHISELPFYAEIQKSPQGNFSYTEGSNTYQVLYQTLDSRKVVTGMKVIAVIPLTELMPAIHQLRSVAIYLFIMASAISGVLIFLFSTGMTRRISELSKKMKRVDKDQFQISVKVKGNDEISQLGNMFNLMVQRIGQLISEVYQSEIDRKEMAFRTKEVELYALQTQINPHFLFNVLTMIGGNLLMNGDHKNAKLVGMLAKSFRMTLKNSGQTVALSEELAFIDTYLHLQRCRYTEKFDYVIDIPPDMLGVEVPKLCLQPLIENAITHGIELKESKSTIRISGTYGEGMLRIAVEDDGLGMAEEELLRIRRELDAGSALSADKHVGLRNVNLRLINLYGENHKLALESKQGTGTRVTITIPISSTNGGKAHE
ncbi:sensor histidine kinase [Paenibacillus sp.]|uniref:sensor histidine kinase n=1 Tax=Paenibacillus sp. TaxID=58172 RepID=UPI002D61E381|nr:sensor histidine kinase [Paenibacillus sp.]HZG58666.1 sensor histidine kinase [Paenibacillus sp.]